MQSDAFFFLGILLFIFIAWVATGGPERPISFEGPYLKPISATGSRAEAYGTLPDLPNIPGVGVDSGVSIKGLREDIGDLRDQVQELSALGEASPYKDMITITHSTTGVRSNFAGREYLTIQAGNRLKDEKVNITGWRLESTATRAFGTIPEGATIARSGSINSTEPIVIGKGDKVIVNSGRSPIGVSFKENVCSGYFEEYQDFYPSLSMSCPMPENDIDAFYPGNPQSEDGDECYEMTKKVYDRCQMATTSPRGVGSSCRTFLNTYVNYNGCVLAHAADDNFASRTWRVFLGSRTHLWKDDRETIKLLDSQGRIVDVFAY